MKKTASVSLLSLIGALSLFPVIASATSITASVTNPGTGTGQLADINDTFVHGPFTISYAGDPNSFGSTEDVTAGDGLDESWDWSFDYRDAYDPLVFNAATVLSKAELTLKLVGNSQQVQAGGSENARILWLSTFSVLFPAVDQEITATFDLLDYYTSAQVMERFVSTDYDGTGTIRMRFLDDAVVNYAELSLTTAAVPEPATLLLVGLGLAGLGFMRQRKA